MASPPSRITFYERLRAMMDELRMHVPSLSEDERLRIALEEIHHERIPSSIGRPQAASDSPPTLSQHDPCLRNASQSQRPLSSLPHQNEAPPQTLPTQPPRVPQPLSRQNAMLDVFNQPGNPPFISEFQPLAGHQQHARLYAQPQTSTSSSYQFSQCGVGSPSQGIPANQPFLGLQSLSIGALSTSNVNQARRTSASTLVQCRRGGGACARLQSQPIARNTPNYQRRIQTVRETDPTQLCQVGENGIRLQVRVYPCDDDDKMGRFPCFRILLESVVGFMRDNHLLFESVEDGSMLVSSLLEAIKLRMETSPAAYTFVSGNHFIRGHEGIGLSLLEHTNRGHLYSGQATLRLSTFRPGTTIWHLLSDSTRFSVTSHDFGFYEGHFVINTVVTRSPLKCRFQQRQHICLGERFYDAFSQDRILSSVDYLSSLDTCPDPDKCSESESEGVVVNPANDSDQETEVADADGQSTPQYNVSFTTYMSHLPSLIWNGTPWQPPQGTIPYMTTADFSDGMRMQAHPDNASWRNSKTIFNGSSIEKLVDQVLARIDESLACTDFLAFMGREREFNIVNPTTLDLVSTGHGVETDVMFHAFSKLTANHSAYFSESIDKSCVLRALSPTVAAGAVSDQRRRDMSRLGALSGLMIIGGWKSGPLSPLFIYFLLYSCDFHCLTSDLVEEWHPGLACLITEWIEMGHTGDLTPFQSHLASYHDLQASALAQRDAATHLAYAAILLGRAIVGPEDVRHPELAAFIQGFSLPCRGGFSMQKAVKSMQGGCRRLLRMIWTGIIENIGCLEPALVFSNRSSASDMESFRLYFGTDATPEGLFKDFLSGVGIPSEETWDSYVTLGLLQNIPARADLDKAWFRPQMLTRAMTGSTQLPTDTMTVTFVSRDDSSYAGSGVNRHLDCQPCIDFRTCFRTATVPTSHILKLAASSEPRKAVDMWLLFEILNASGGYSIM